ncbi:integrase [Scytonema sp. UIC 10036]|nr:integrase [Scytonema sp. UIC 10036]MUG96329.1 integrase [Scytonema sp. UIC 10036]
MRHIQEISGHTDVSVLQRYLEVTDEQKKAAVSAIKF